MNNQVESENHIKNDKTEQLNSELPALTKCQYISRHEIALKKQCVIESIQNDSSITGACEKANIGRNWFYKWLREDDNFAKAVEIAKLGRIDTMADALFKNGVNGNVTAQIFWLCNRDPDKWRNIQRQEMVLTNARGVEIYEKLEIGKMSEEERKGVLKVLDAEIVEK